MQRYEIIEYQGPRNQRPFEAWIKGLDSPIRARILKRLKRMRHGSFGDHRHLEKGLFEARFHFGPGYRVYFGIQQDRLILLLGGGDKSTQIEDIFTSLQRWSDYKETAP